MVPRGLGHEIDFAADNIADGDESCSKRLAGPASLCGSMARTILPASPSKAASAIGSGHGEAPCAAAAFRQILLSSRSSRGVPFALNQLAVIS
jgi:hypothetical protein